MAEEEYTGDDEYEFSDTSGDEFGAEGVALPGPEASPMRRFALIGVGLLLVIFVVYKMLGMFFGPTVPKKPAAPIPKPPIAQPELITPQPIVGLPAAEPATSPPVQAAVVSDDVKKQLAALQIASEARRNQVNHVQDDVASINASVSALENKITALTTAMESLVNQMQRQEAKFTAEFRKQRVKSGSEHRAKQLTDPYHVQAIIPGRAWLVSKTGKTLTVREGSQVPGHGRVTQIDTHQGLVRLSNGHTLGFAPSDS